MAYPALSSLTQRVITGVILLALFLSALFFSSNIVWMVVVSLVTLLTAGELGKLLAASGYERFGMSVAPHYRWAIPVQVLVFSAAVLWFLIRLDPVAQIHFACAIYIVAVLLSLFVLPHWICRFEWGKLNVSTITRGMIGGVGVWLLIATWMALAQLRLLSPFALLMVMVLVWLADSAAYFAGRRFGKHKLAPKTSPGKTREGAIGAFVAVTIYAAVLAPFVMPKLSQLATLPSSLAWGIWLALAWLLLFLSILGDLFESLIKRFADQKDSGVILPGHGGWLDRVDSLLTTLPTAALAVSFLI